MTIDPYVSPESPGESAETKDRWCGHFTLVEVLVAVAVIGMVVALLLPAKRGVGEAARRTQCSNNLKQIGLAMQNYLDINGTFPPAYITDADGKPMHSWRVLILPYMEQADLHDRYDQSQPWDSTVNRQLLSEMPYTYQCPSSGHGGRNTSYVVVQGKESIFNADKPCKIDSITDGAANTILVVEAPHADIPWTPPRDLDFAELTMSINTGTNSPHSDHPNGLNVLLADGSVRFIRGTISPQDLRALLTKDGGETVSGSF